MVITTPSKELRSKEPDGWHSINEKGETEMSTMKKLAVLSAAFGLLAATSSGVLAQKKYDPGASDTEIKIGNIMPYSGPASAYGVIGKTEEAYFKKVNAEGGINGRKINFISYDDALQPAEDGGAGAQAGRERRGAAGLQSAGYPVEYGDPEVPEHARRCRNCSSPPAPPSGTIRRTSRGRWAGSPTTRAKPRSTRSTF